MTDITIHGFAQSTYVRTAMLTCAEKDVPYALAPLEFGGASHLALHPFGKMPAMTHGAVRLYETAAIACYVDETFAGPSLQPSEPAARAAMWQFVSVANAYMYEAFVHARIEPPADGAYSDPAQRNLAVIEQALADTSFVAGDALTLADLFIAPMLSFDVGTREAGIAALRDWPSVARWLKAMTERDSWTQTAA